MLRYPSRPKVTISVTTTNSSSLALMLLVISRHRIWNGPSNSSSSWACGCPLRGRDAAASPLGVFFGFGSVSCIGHHGGRDRYRLRLFGRGVVLLFVREDRQVFRRKPEQGKTGSN